jgi:group I intron endonuclease
MIYLYKITSIQDNKVYIGQTVDAKRRWQAHKSFARHDNPVQYVHRAMKKYGIDNFVYEVIATCKTSEDADETEMLLIKQYDSRNKDFGYNIAPGGDSPWNRDLPKELNPLTGVPRSAEIRDKISKATIGKEMLLHTDEWKKNMSKIMTGRTIPKEQVEKIATANRGQKRSEEARHNISIAHVGVQSGENHPRAKLNWEKVRKIRQEYSNGDVSHRALAKKYNMSQGNISDVLNYKIWKE